ncbi:MRGRD protein, partial [Dromaius novaehollandiae]|nr:MRGRD protein [Dromaius novaehollandiae]
DTNTTALSLSYMATGYTDSMENTEILCTVGHTGIMIFAGVCMGISLCGLVGNGMVVWFLGFHMKKSPFTVYILNLAITDFSLLLFLLVILSPYIIIEISCSPLYNYIFPKYLLMDLILLWYFTSMYLLTAMSMERCLSVL